MRADASGNFQLSFWLQLYACKKHDLKLGVTPFYLLAVKEAKKYVDFFKVASYELMFLDLHNLSL